MNLHLENFAKIKNSDIKISDFTILVGKPSTNKSYVMKLVYSIYESNKDVLIENFDDFDSDDLYNLLRIEDKSIKNIEAFKLIYKNILNSIFKDINSQISSNFTLKLNELSINYKESKFEIENSVSEKIKNIIFVETPLLLELEKFMIKERYKTPYHIESLLNFLREDYSFTSEEEDEFINNFTQKIENIINGNIRSGSHGFEFESKSGKNYNIINTPSGVKSFGLVQYLIKNKALLPNSVLFWEEPEVHLHPEWQKKLIDIFLELIQNGIKIFISTHSPYITDYLNARVKKLNLEDKVAFNLLGFEDEKQSIVKNTIVDEYNWDLLQSELLEPLEEIMWEYI